MIIVNYFDIVKKELGNSQLCFGNKTKLFSLLNGMYFIVLCEVIVNFISFNF